VHFAFFPRQCARWQKIVAALRARGVTTSWDFGWNEPLLHDSAFLELAASVDYLMLNEQEAQLYSRSRSLPRAISYWRDASRTSVLKLGPRGSQWISRPLTIEEPAPRVRAVDTTGAGDAFNGGFLAARLAGRGPRRALQAGNRIGALSTCALGGIEGLPRPATTR
jgi:sugar/nucleoside kinase (ribokinase family)